MLRDLALAGLVVLAACSSETTLVELDQDAVDAAAQFQRVADDAFAAGADPSVVSAYRDIGIAVARHARVSPVTIVVDGVALEFMATARQLEIDPGPECRSPTALCLLIPPLRSVIAWQRSDPRRVVQLTGSAVSTTIGPLAPGMPDTPFLTAGTLTYFDGAGGFYTGTSGTQRIGDPVTSDTPCREQSLPVMPLLPAATCTRAEFTASFSGTVAPAPMMLRSNAASGTHTIAMASQSIHGARLVLTPTPLLPCPTCEGGYPRELLPPIDLRAGALRANMSAAATATEVTFTLGVTNGLAVPATIQFTSGQQFDITVHRADGTSVWTWSADKAFTQALGSRTLAAGETVTYTATWAPTVKGELYAVGRLVSSSHAARGTVRFVVP